MASCSPEAEPPATLEELPAVAQEPPGAIELAEERIVLFGLETRDHEVWLHAGEHYTIKNKDGTVLASQIDQAAFERDFAELAADMARMIDLQDGGQLMGIGGD
ncbi:MAG TPA: hypothetical protein VF530_14190 [Planctomycetota bacterium]